MSAEAKKGLLPEGGEMLYLAFVMFFGVIGILALVLLLAPSTDL